MNAPVHQVPEEEEEHEESLTAEHYKNKAEV
jgi:hypothetical protein